MYNFITEKEPFARGFINCARDGYSMRTGEGFLCAAKEMNISIDKQTGLPEAYFNRTMCIGISFDEGIYIWEPGIDSYIQNDPVAANDYIFMRSFMSEYTVKKQLRALYTDCEQAYLEEHALWGGTWIGHAVPNLIDFATLGTDKMREKIKACQFQNPHNDDFYDGLILILDAVDILGERFASLAREMLRGELEPAFRRKVERIAAAFEVCPKKPAFDFPSACAVYIMMVTLDGVDSPGHFDWYMIDFFRKTDPAIARETLFDVWEFFHKTRTWNLCISGCDEFGVDKTNELSYAILDAAEHFLYQTPNLTMRCHKNTPPELLSRATEVLACGMGLPAIYNDEVVCASLESLGIPPHDAHEYVLNGCNQIDIQGKSHMGLEDGEVNLGKAVELALNNGFSMKSGKLMGKSVGDAASFKSFDEVMAAYIAQLDYMCDKACEISNRGQKICAEKYFNPFRTLTIEGCLEKGRSYKDKGPLYGHGQILAEGVADAADSLAAIKKFVFDEKKFNMQTLISALKANFEGYDEIYKLLYANDCRFGNDIDYVDNIAVFIVNHFNTYLKAIPTYRGGFFSGGCSPFNRAAENGLGVAALPNGKKSGEALFADSIGATPGRDINGPTALLLSCLKYDHKLAGSGFILNVKFDKDLFMTAKGKEAFACLLKTYFAGGGQMMTATVVSREELLDARQNPDAHRDLIVRVGGYSDYFVNLSRELQDNVIARTNNLL